MPKARNRLVYLDRKELEKGLKHRLDFGQIATKINVHPTTVSREIRNNRMKMDDRSNVRHKRDTCRKSSFCTVTNLCSASCQGVCRECSRVDCRNKCTLYQPRQCELLSKKPYVCNGCNRADFAKGCDCERWFYDAAAAQKLHDDRMKESREGITVTMEELAEMDELILPLMKKGQSLEHIWSTHPGKFPIGPRTYYNYIKKGYTEAKPIHGRFMVKSKPRKVKKKPQVGDNPNYVGRTYDDFKNLGDDAKMNAIEMDCVESARGCKKTILTLLHRRTNFQMMLLLEAHTLNEVKRALDEIEEAIGLEAFRRCMGTIVTDHGHEFNNFALLEASCTKLGEKRCKIFYCDPNRPDQKGACEKNHVELRRILPKKTKFTKLTKTDLSLICSHVNSYTRPSLHGAAPVDIAMTMLPKELFEKLGVKRIDPEEVIMKPSLLPHLM